MQLNVDNCPRCGKVFNTTLGDVCHNCKKEIDKDYENCSTYLRENRGATISELSEATGVSMRQITKFIRERRISIADSPNLGYPCESCGELIREGKLCQSCHNRLSKKLSNLREEEQIRSEYRDRKGYQFKQNHN